ALTDTSFLPTNIEPKPQRNASHCPPRLVTTGPERVKKSRFQKWKPAAQGAQPPCWETQWAGLFSLAEGVTLARNAAPKRRNSPTCSALELCPCRALRLICNKIEKSEEFENGRRHRHQMCACLLSELGDPETPHEFQHHCQRPSGLGDFQLCWDEAQVQELKQHRHGLMVLGLPHVLSLGESRWESLRYISSRSWHQVSDVSRVSHVDAGTGLLLELQCVSCSADRALR
ncbi:hypothetical protein BaRGS_00008116, partial [Batillaria attramentaria]